MESNPNTDSKTDTDTDSDPTQLVDRAGEHADDDDHQQPRQHRSCDSSEFVDIPTPVGFEPTDSSVTGDPCRLDRDTGQLVGPDDDPIDTHDFVELRADFWSVETEDTHRVAGRFVVLDTLTVPVEQGPDVGADPDGPTETEECAHYVLVPEAQADDPHTIDTLYRINAELTALKIAGVTDVASIDAVDRSLQIERRLTDHGPFPGAPVELRLIGSRRPRPRSTSFLPDELR